MIKRKTSGLYSKLALLVGLPVCFMLWSSVSEATEQRCNELGANCVCANDLGASGWNLQSYPWYTTETNDANDLKPCDTSGGKERIIAGGAAPQVVRGLNGYNAWRDTMTAGTSAVQPTSAQKANMSGRVAARYYIKWGTGYVSAGGGCTNDKYIQLGDYLTADGSGFTSSNGGRFSPSVRPQDYIGKWVRLEMVLDSYSSPSTMWFYLKNVTDNTPEISYSVSTRTASSTSLAGFTDIVHKYRAGTCAGSTDMMFAMLAHWPTNAGQRIGPAPELENGSGDVTAPNAPTNLHIQ